MKIIIGNKDLTTIIQDNEELKIELIKYNNEKNKKENDTKLLLKNINFKNSKLESLSPIKIGLNKNFNHLSPKFEKINFGNKPFLRVFSLPRFSNAQKDKIKSINKIESNFSSQDKKLFLKKKTYTNNNSNY